MLLQGDRVFRALDETAATDFRALRASRFYADAIARGELVSTRVLDEDSSPVVDDSWEEVLEHERVPVVSYPYEWSFTMLRDAALLQLNLALAALDAGMITKDASAYNVQFVGSRAKHIDIGSFEILSPGEPWFGYRQFCEQMLFPLVLTARRGITHQASLRGRLQGLSPQACAGSLRWWDLLHPSLFVHVGLQARTDRRRIEPDPDVRAELRAAGYGPTVMAGMLRRLRRLVESLEWRAAGSAWVDYSDRKHYTEDGLRAKAQLVQRVAGQRHRRQVLDLGANDGYFSELVRPMADYVVAVDQDPLVIDRLYRQLAARGDERVLALVVDLADVPGGLGWRGRERAPFLERVRPDLVLCLALVHHLAISASIPLDEVVEFLADRASEVVLELPTLEDPMVKLLLAQKKTPAVVAKRYSVDQVEAALDQRFVTHRREITGTRILYHLAPRGQRAGIEVRSVGSSPDPGEPGASSR